MYCNPEDFIEEREVRLWTPTFQQSAAGTEEPDAHAESRRKQVEHGGEL
jgi:hypothetical protein